MAGLAGRLPASVTALARYRLVQLETGLGNRTADGQLALALRPCRSDRVALLFGYDTVQSGTPALVQGLSGVRRTDRLAADGFAALAPGLEFYARAAVAWRPAGVGTSRTTSLWQGRLQ